MYSDDEGEATSEETLYFDDTNYSDNISVSSNSSLNSEGTYEFLPFDGSDVEDIPDLSHETGQPDKFIKSKHFEELNSTLPSPKDSKTIFEVMFLIFHFSMRHNLSKVAVQDLVKLVNCILGTESLPHTKYMFSQTFSSDIPFEFHLYCNKCSLSINFNEKSITNVT